MRFFVCCEALQGFAELNIIRVSGHVSVYQYWDQIGISLLSTYSGLYMDEMICLSYRFANG